MADQLKLRLEREDKEDGSITYHLWSVDGDWIVGLNDDETKQGGKSRSYANSIVRAVNAHDDLVEALNVVRMSAGWREASDETRALVDAALVKAAS